MRENNPTQHHTGTTSQQNRPSKQQNKPTGTEPTPSNLVLKLVTGDTHTVQAADYQTVIDAVGSSTTTMIAFHASGRRVYIPCRAIVSMVESLPSETLPAGGWNVERN